MKHRVSAFGWEMRNLRNFYRLLHVQPDAPVEVIRASYRTLMREMKQHPDLGGSDSGAALLNEAYQTLRNPVLRAAYDRELSVRFERKSRPSNVHVGHARSVPFCPYCRSTLTHSNEAAQICPICGENLRAGREMAQADSSRRAVMRIKRNDVLFYCARSPQRAYEAKMIDLSPRGMRFLCYQNLVPGTVLKINGSELNASAIVTNHRQELVDGHNLHSVGVSFLEVEFDSPRGSFLSISV